MFRTGAAIGSNDRPIRPGVSRDRHERWPLHSAHLTSSARRTAAPLTLNRLTVAQEYSTIPPWLRWSPRTTFLTTFVTTFACFAVPF